MNEDRLMVVLQQLKRWINRLGINNQLNNQLVFNMGNTRLRSTPKLAQVYWCEFSPPVLPELGKNRPVVVLSRQNTLGGMVTVAPITTSPQQNAEKRRWVKIQAPFNENEEAWVLCKHIIAVSARRLNVHNNDIERDDITKIPDVKFQEIVHKILNDLPERR